MLKSLPAFGASFVTTPICVYLAFIYSEPLPGYVRLALFVLAALGAGLMLGRLFGRERRTSIGLGALTALLVLWAPLIVLTYGFALIGVPIPMGLAVCVAIGASFAKRSTEG